MKVTALRAIVVGNPWKNWIYIVMDTDEGIRGLGEATGGLMTQPIAAAAQELSHLCLGEDPTRIHALWDKLYKAAFLTENSAHLHAMTGIETACWDILGKSLGAPVWKLLGGPVRDRVRVYANGWYKGERTPESYARQAKEVVAMGYGALKLDPFGNAYHVLTPRENRECRDILAAIREAVGPEVEVMVEGHDRFTVSEAIRIGHWLADIKPAWFEAPVLSTDVDALAAVAKAVPVPVAAGERFNTPNQFARLLAHDCIDILQPEPLNLGGIWRTLEVAGMARAHHANLAIHNAESPVKTVMNAHICAVAQNILIQECFDEFLEPWVNDLLDGVVRVQDGYLSIPDRPGLGIELNEAEAKKHPYSPDHFLRLFESGWEKRTGVGK